MGQPIGQGRDRSGILRGLREGLKCGSEEWIQRDINLSKVRGIKGSEGIPSRVLGMYGWSPGPLVMVVPLAPASHVAAHHSPEPVDVSPLPPPHTSTLLLA